LQVNVAEGNGLPRIALLLLIVTGADAAFTQVAVTLFSGCAVMVLRVVSAGSDVDHVPIESGVMGQFPEMLSERIKWAWFPGGAAA
jgi:hypothetical protein